MPRRSSRARRSASTAGGRLHRACAYRLDQRCENRAALCDAGELYAFAATARVMRDGAEAVERSHAECRGEAAIRAAGGHHVVCGDAERCTNLLRSTIQLERAVAGRE